MSDHAAQHHSEPSSANRLMTAQQVAELLEVDPSWIYAETRAGRFPHVRVGRYRRFKLSAVERWIEDHERGPAR
ncbi:MAG TPA: helix-turn-helix domain-containing protein [Baekduia sp.]|uniref:helix-turn-helix domain-containing protein n=1 Tax=Baekduia sp. TaxID=2600305 RepID=UPI002C13E579|nr:helix-turn-helix domain-containing protein [Baekduia sp.]HMJ36767.1 helix-turn-helix domain-containing protein [Baekduia sp.]